MLRQLKGFVSGGRVPILRHTHRANAPTVVAAVVVQAHAARIDAEVVSAARVVGVERARPIVAIGAGSRQEQRFTILLAC